MSDNNNNNMNKKRKIMESDDSDDDVPLSELRKKVTVKKESESTKDSDTKAIVKNGIIKPRPASSSSSSSVGIKKEPKEVKANAKDDSDDSDDDVPIAVLMKRKQEAALAAKKAASPPPAKKIKVEVKKSKTTPVLKKKPEKSSSSSTRSLSSSGGSKKIQGDPMKSSELTEKFYTTLDKGKLCQRLLCRWWYALSWPQEGVQNLCPKGYESLPGFPGVFVGTAANCLGQLVDKRDQDTCPNLRNLSQKSSAELKDLCIIAYEEQIRQLVESEGPDTKLERTLKRELAEIKHIKPEKADKQADKLLKQPF